MEKTKKLIIPKGRFADHWCSCCSGKGMMRCPRCAGTKTFTDGSDCYYCRGAGVVECTACDGKGYIKD